MMNFKVNYLSVKVEKNKRQWLDKYFKRASSNAEYREKFPEKSSLFTPLARIICKMIKFFDDSGKKGDEGRERVGGQFYIKEAHAARARLDSLRERERERERVGLSFQEVYNLSCSLALQKNRQPARRGWNEFEEKEARASEGKKTQRGSRERRAAVAE